VSAADAGGASRTAIRVLLVDDHVVVRVGLRALLEAAPDVNVIGEASDGHVALELVASHDPDVVVLDLSMAGLDGAATTREITRRGARARVLVLTMHDEEEYLIPLLEAGATGYVVKSAASADLLRAVRTVAAGRTFVRPEAAAVLAAGWTRRTAQDEARARYEALSARERDVFLLIAQGYSSSQIGERLNISAKTADTYRRRVNEKLGTAERADYVRLALELGLLAAVR
jgi:DNA-binding NarL/FixJ family response regulator